MNIKQVFINSLLPQRETEILLSFLIKKSREFLLTHPEVPVSTRVYGKFKALSKKRLADWPIAYLIGQKEFFGLNFAANKNVLVPRPETEMMVEKILAHLKTGVKDTTASQTIIDIGTGSGAIIIAAAQSLSSAPDFKRLSFLAIDISYPALVVAKKNARRLGLNKVIKFYQGNLLSPALKKITGRDLIISANLPYLTNKQIAVSPSIKREPRLALNGGPDGLKYYRELFKQLSGLDYKSLFLIGEISPEQKTKILTLAKKYFPELKTTILKDLSGHNRFFIVN